MIIKDNVLFGLTNEEVSERIEKGQLNITENRKTKSYLEIFLNNILTVFNLLILVMTILVIPTINSLSDLTNLSFVATALANLIIGIVQEIKAKKIVDKLVLVNESKTKVLRNLSLKEVGKSEVVLDDTIFLEQASVIPADSTVVKGEIYVNESNLTGESDDILKKKGDFLYSGSFAVSGEAYAKVIHVGKDNFIEQLSKQATKYSKPKSDIMIALNRIITVISILLIPISIFLYLAYSSYPKFDFEGSRLIYNFISKELVLALVSSINGMIPYGLFLLTSVSLAASVIKLANNRTVVQELYCIEQLARVDVICLDKTGTITDGTMRVDDLIVTNAKYSPVEIISSMNASLKGENLTSKALIEKFGKKQLFKPKTILNFNSTNKFSAVAFQDVGTFALGAPDILLKLKKTEKNYKLIEEKAKEGNRVLALCKTSSSIKDNKLAGPFELVALIIIHDNIRKGAKETLKEFHDNGVDIKIISGDNPMTVSAIAKDAGVPNYDKYISLDGMSDEEVIDAAFKYTVFGRVKPNQKKLLVQSLKQKGHKVAMTGDGVNDILALRESDCSIAMANGSDAVKTVAHLVLLDSNFLSLPKVVGEGRKVINNIERSAALFLSKTFMMAMINILTIILYYANPELQFTSPFNEPSQMLIIETFVIGIPSVVLALEPNYQRINGKFISNIFKKALPGSILVFTELIIIKYASSIFGITNTNDISNLSIFVASISFSFILLYISVPFTKFRLIVFILTELLVMSCPLISYFTITKFGVEFFHYGLGESGYIEMGSKAILVMILLVIISLLYFAVLSMLKVIKTKKENHEEIYVQNN